MIRRLLIIGVGLAAVVVVALVAAVYWVVSGDGARTALERQLSAWLGEPVRIGDAQVTLLPRPGISLQDVTVGEPATLALDRVDLSTGLRALLSGRLEDAEVIVSESRIAMPLPFAIPGVAAPGTAGLGAAAAVASELQLVSVRRINLRDVVIVSMGREVRVSGESALNGSRLAISRFTASTDDVELEARGTVDFEPSVVASLQATSPLLDVDALMAVVSAFTGTLAPGADPSPQSTRLSARVTAPRARAAGVDLTDFDAVVTAYAGEIAIDPMRFGLFGGTHEGWLSATLGDTPSIRLGSSVAGVDVGQLSAFGGTPGAMTGRLSGTARVGANGRDLASVLASARGIGQATVEGGTMPGLELVRTVVGFLGRDPGARQQQGSAFERITAGFALVDRRITSEDVSLESADVDVLARGSLDLDGKRLDGRANLLLSEALSAQANQTVYRYAAMGNRVVLPATISGTLAEPRIGIDAAAAVRRGVGNEVERRLRDFFERVGPP